MQTFSLMCKTSQQKFVLMRTSRRHLQIKTTYDKNILWHLMMTSYGKRSYHETKHLTTSYDKKISYDKNWQPFCNLIRFWLCSTSLKQQRFLIYLHDVTECGTIIKSSYLSSLLDLFGDSRFKQPSPSLQVLVCSLLVSTEPLLFFVYV